MASELLGSPQNLSMLGKYLGVDDGKVKSAVALAGPALLGGLMKKASTPSGAGDLFKSLNDIDDGLAGNLGNLLGGGGPNLAKVTEMGGKLLGGLLGGQKDSWIGALAKMAGLGNSSIVSLLSLALPLLLSVIKRQVKAQSLDEKGFANLLAGQKSFLSGKLPAELTGALGLADLAGSAATQVQRAPAAAQAGLGKLLWPLVAVAALAAVYFFWPSGDRAQKGVAPGPGTADTTGGKDVPLGDLTGLTTGLTKTLTDLTTGLAGIKDEAGAKGFVETITKAQSDIRGMELDSLNGAAKTTVGGVLRPLLEKIQAALATAYKIPGVQAAIEPAIKPLLETLQAVAG